MSAGVVWRRGWPEARGAGAAGEGQVWIGRAAEVPPPPRSIEPTGADTTEALRRPEALRAAFVGRRLLLRRFVATLTGHPAATVEVRTDRGRPRLEPPLDALSISTASRDGWIALALAGSPVGVDIEPVGLPQEPAWNMLSSREEADLRRTPAADRWPAFLALWTAKEAYLKAIGLGVAREPRMIDVTVHGSSLHILDAGRPAAAVGEGRSLTLPGGLVRAACVTLRRPP